MNYSKNDRYKDNPILKKTFDFSIEIIKYSELLEENRKYTLAKQIIRSGTSIGANVKESQNAESKADFIHKLKIALKEADETEYWLLLCDQLENYPDPTLLLTQLVEIIKILNKIISSSKENLISNQS